MGSISGVLSAANLFTLVVPIHVYLSSLFAELLARHFSLCVSHHHRQKVVAVVAFLRHDHLFSV
jgi:hypothetical protein